MTTFMDFADTYFGGTMNFLMRSSHVQRVSAEQPSVPEPPADAHPTPKSATTLEGLIAEDSYPQYSTIDDHVGESEYRGENAIGANNESSVIAKHYDVSDEEGWIAIPYKELPDNWNDAPDIHSLRSLDRSFVFPGEQVHILACLSACKQDTEIITPFKLAAAMSKNGIRQSPKKQNGNAEEGNGALLRKGEMSPDSQGAEQNGETLSKEKTELQKDVTDSESLLRMEDHKRQTEILLQRFERSHFFVRIAESSETLWSKKSAPKKSSVSLGMDGQESKENGTQKNAVNVSRLNAIIDKGNFDPKVSGGVARNNVKCCSLSNGDIVVLLQVNVGVDFLNDPVIEILQFEKSREGSLSSETQENLVDANQDPCGELLKWLLPLDNTLPPTARPLSPPLTSNSGMGSTSQKSGSQLFSHFRSYSMSSLPQNTTPPPAPIKAASSKPTFDLEDWDQSSSQQFWKSQKTGYEVLLSFRGVSLERERFSVRCGLEGIYTPGRRWRRKLEIIQPVEIHSFAADCNTDDLLCVQIKNVSPAHAPHIVVYIDAITIVFEEASKGGQSLSLPIACIEAGNDHSLPNLALRRGEEHSFILKPATSLWKNLKAGGDRRTQSSQLQAGNAASSLRPPSKAVELKRSASTADQYAIMVSCRCNYTESRLFFKQPTSWQPRVSRDLMISVASEMSGQSSAPSGGVSQLPVQVLTLQVSNLMSEDLTLTVLAPASFTSLPSVVSLNSSPSSPMSPFVGFPEFTGRSPTMQRLSSPLLSSKNQKQNGTGGVWPASFNEQASPISDAIPSNGLCCTHLWLQSRVPLGCVPSQSMATIKLELLPLTDGIITLDTLQIDVKEKGLTYIPEYSLKINATSSISTGIF
ncbi:PREDICTED: ZEAMMB73_Zm00001d001834 [Prunus dulcis]|uniref:PREDICTED: ZEAMMB73_Zm00001d001834 n=2 Tax=Prunus dulcis TaxID=3755 RepID=A0A5E4FI84_PRUDU|nr:PREDICTED: ZEAMMB73_Zm00001d001834 [Prunus dulcis]